MIVAGVLIAFVAELKKVLFEKKKVILIYLLSLVVGFALAGFFTTRGLFGQKIMTNNIVIQVWFFILGSLHIWACLNVFNWKEEKMGLQISIFTIIVMLLGSTIFLNVNEHFGLDGMHYFFLTGFVAFIAPAFILLLVDAAVDIPMPLFTKWYYPDQRKMEKPEKDELRDPMLVALEIQKDPTGPVSVIKAKAPEQMSFGRFFYHFVNDYNLHNPQSPIAVHTDKGENYGWHFYIKGGFLQGWQLVNTEQTIVRNNFKENEVVVCKRAED